MYNILYFYGLSRVWYVCLDVAYSTYDHIRVLLVTRNSIRKISTKKKKENKEKNKQNKVQWNVGKKVNNASQNEDITVYE